MNVKKVLEMNPGILKIPDVKKEFLSVVERVGKILDEIEEYSLEDRFKMGLEFCNEFCVDDVLEFIINRGDGAFISGVLSGILRKERFLELNLKRRLNYLGYRLKKGKILIRGNVGNKLGFEMGGGEIVVEGNAGNWVGEEMKGGKILVKGDVGSYLGLKMKDGEIIVEGNAGYGVGEGMYGGEIFIRGNAKNVGVDMRGGVIRVMGKATFGYRGAGKVYYWEGEWKEKPVDYYIYYPC